MNIIIDTHEHPDTKEQWLKFNSDHRWVDLTFKELLAGDITTDSMKVGFEFKRKSDFEASISDGRLPEYQPAKLLQTYQQAYIIVAGQLNTNDNVIRGTMASCFARGVPVIQVPTFYDVMTVTTSILEKCNDGKDRTCCHHIKPKIIENPQLSVLCGIPGINKERAERLLNRFDSVINIANAPKTELKEVTGIGDKLADSIYFALNDKRPKYPEW